MTSYDDHRAACRARSRRRFRLLLLAYVLGAVTVFGYAWTGPCELTRTSFGPGGQLQQVFDPVGTTGCSIFLSGLWPAYVSARVSTEAWRLLRQLPRIRIEQQQ